MSRTVIVVASTLLLLLSVIAIGAAAQPGESSRSDVRIPPTAEQVAPGVYHLGSREHDGELVDGYMFVRYDRGRAKPQDPGHGHGGGKDTSTCYAFLFDKSTRWTTQEPWVMNPTNDAGLSKPTLFANQSNDLQKWEHVQGVGPIFGAGSTTTQPLTADTNSPDDRNEVYFGDIDAPGAIAVTIVWAVTRGPPSQRHLVEWDQVYDQQDFDWSLTGAPGTMDFDNIATHEDGHAVGLGHPAASCTEQTMYAYADSGETKKRTLEDGDRAGAQVLY